MISTVTTTVAMISGLGLGTILGAAATIALVLLFAQREVLLVAGPRFRPIARNLSVSIVGLLVTFAVIVVSRLMSIL